MNEEPSEKRMAYVLGAIHSLIDEIMMHDEEFEREDIISKIELMNSYLHTIHFGPGPEER